MLGQGLHTTITVWFFAIFARFLVVILLDFVDSLVGRPEEVRNCLTVEALIPKFTFSGSEPIAFATFNLLSCATTTPTIFV